MRGYLRRRAERSLGAGELTIIPRAFAYKVHSPRRRLSLSFLLRGRPPRGSPSANAGALRPGIDSGAKGIKSLSISGIPGRSPSTPGRPALHLLGAQFTPVTDSWRVNKLGRGGIFVLYCALYRGTKFDEIL